MLGKLLSLSLIYPSISLHFTLSHECTKRRMVNIMNHGQPNFTLMMWGSIWLGGRSDILLMGRDRESRGGGYTT